MIWNMTSSILLYAIYCQFYPEINDLKGGAYTRVNQQSNLLIKLCFSAREREKKNTLYNLYYTILSHLAKIFYLWNLQTYIFVYNVPYTTHNIINIILVYTRPGVLSK